MTTEELCFVRAINADPDDDTARLVYADWLEENGRGPVAVFIREQCAGRAVSIPLTWLVPLETFLGRQPHETFRGTVLEGAWAIGSGERSVNFRRGFVESVTCAAEDWWAHADSLYWRPGLAVRCDACSGGALSYIPRCGVCNGTGRVEHPCPPTAQPIRKVTLTTMPGWRIAPASPGVPPLTGRLARGPENDAATLRWLGQKWPGVAFELPSPSPVNQYSHWARA